MSFIFTDNSYKFLVSSGDSKSSISSFTYFYNYVINI